MRYTGNKNWDNGDTEHRNFEFYTELCDWLAGSPEAGITAFDNDQDIWVDQIALATDVQMS